MILEFTVDGHFAKKDQIVRDIYEQLKESVKRFGLVAEDPKKTSIHLVNRTAFAGVATRKSHLVLTIKSDRNLTSPRIHKSEQASANRFHHEIKLASPNDVDEELVRWLQAAFSMSA